MLCRPSLNSNSVNFPHFQAKARLRWWLTGRPNWSERRLGSSRWGRRRRGGERRRRGWTRSRPPSPWSAQETDRRPRLSAVSQISLDFGWVAQWCEASVKSVTLFENDPTDLGPIRRHLLLAKEGLIGSVKACKTKLKCPFPCSPQLS